MKRSRYPMNWEAMGRAVRARAEHRCECVGECGLHYERRCEELNTKPAKWAKGKVVLTVAHLDHDPETCRDLERLKAMCQRCHLRYDRDLHAKTAKATRARKAPHAPL
jgi:hypothetical protein